MDLKHLILLACWPYSGGTSSSHTFILHFLNAVSAKRTQPKKRKRKKWRASVVIYLICNLHAVVSQGFLNAFLKIPFSPRLSPTPSRQTQSWLLVLIKLCIPASPGYSPARKLCFTEVIIRHPVLNLLRLTHKLQSLNLARLLSLILLCGKGQRAMDQVPATQIIQLPFMSPRKLREKSESRKTDCA